MKSVLLLLLSLSLSYASTTKGSTIFDYLKDGFDTVYKFKEQSVISHHKLKEFEEQTFDVHLRKSLQNGPKKFVMHLENVQLKGEHDEPPTEADLAALVLPIVVAVHNDDLDIDQVYATEADTRKSLGWKHDAMVLLLHNMTEQISDLKDMDAMNSITVQMEMDGMPFGKCNIDFTVKKKKGRMGIEMSTKREQCVGELQKDLVEEFNKYDVTDIHASSEMKFGFYYDLATGQFLRSFLKMRGKLVSEQDVKFAVGMELHFDSFAEIQENFDENKNTKVYKESDIE